MPSKIDIVQRNRFVYAAASPPTIDVGVFTIARTGIDLKTAGTTTLFTVPTGRSFVAQLCTVLVTAVDTGGAGTENLAIKESSSSRVMITGVVTPSHTPVAGQTCYMWQAAAQGSTVAVSSTCTAGNIVQVVVATSQGGSTGVTGTVFITGFYVS